LIAHFTCNAVFGRELQLGRCRLVLDDHPCPDARVSFFLFTRANPIEGQQVEIGLRGKNSISLSHYNSSRPSKILIHGYNGHKYLDLLMDIKTEYLLEGDYNVLTVDWRSLSARPCYPLAAINTKHAGKCVAHFIRQLLMLTTDQIHLIGFSLGAHVAASAAMHLRPIKVARITDPMSCDHHRSLMYFAESIRSVAGFWGWPCSNMAAYLQFRCPPRGAPCLMGANTPNTSRGFCLVYTAESPPYALGRWTSNNTRWNNRILPEKWNPKQIDSNLIV
ncbi:hypothetical protein LSTR_LSTR014804, partial [Laodelphax striatellus]